MFVHDDIENWASPAEVDSWKIKCDIIKMKGTELHLSFFAETGNIEMSLLTTQIIIQINLVN